MLWSIRVSMRQRKHTEKLVSIMFTLYRTVRTNRVEAQKKQQNGPQLINICQLCPYKSPLPLSVWPHSVSWCWSWEKEGEQLKWSLAFRLYIGSFPCAQLPGPVHTARLSWVFFCVFSLGLCFVCSFVLFDLFVCPHSFVFPWADESSPLQFLALA